MQTPKNNFQHSCSFSCQPKWFPTTDNETEHSSNIRSGCSFTTHTDCRSTALSSRTLQYVVEKEQLKRKLISSIKKNNNEDTLLGRFNTHTPPPLVLYNTQLGKISKCTGLYFVFLILNNRQAGSVAVITCSTQHHPNFSHNFQPCSDKIHLR